MLFAAAVLATAAGCSSEVPDTNSDTTWVGTITTEGNVTTVINESGSVWGGTATLVEEMSIGVEAGADEYMFGRISALHATNERIYVIDPQVPAVRVYDHAGSFLGNLGQEGQGPGEYTMPSLLAADAAGRVFVLDSRLRRINVYSPSGESVESWPITNSRCCIWPMFALGRDTLWAPVRELLEETRNYRNGIQNVGPSGPYGEVTWVPELEYERATFTVNGRELDAPLGPTLIWNPTPGGGIVVGASDRYRFEVHRADGSRLVIERYWDPTPIPAERKAWERRFRTSFERAFNDPEFSWDGAGMPEHMPAYSGLKPTLSGETWVFRQGASERVPGCVENPLEVDYREAAENRCWSAQRIMDVFGEDGRYLGEVQIPPVLQSYVTNLFVDGTRVVGRAQDEQGTFRVKLYRLVLPGEPS